MPIHTSIRRGGARFIKRMIWSLPAFSLIFVIGASSATAQYKLRKPTQANEAASITVTAPSAGTAWEQGKRYEITWTSTGLRGAVKVDLVDAKGKTTSLTRQTMNNGKHSFTLKQSVADGDYKIRISSTDGKVVGESAGMVHIGKATGAGQKTAVVGTSQGGGGQAAQSAGTTKTGGKTFTPAATGTYTPASGTAGQVTGGPSVGVQGGGATVAEGSEPAELHEGAGMGAGTVQVGTLTPIQVPESDLGRMLVDPSDDLQAMPGAQQMHPAGQPGNPTIAVTRPNDEDSWIAGTTYPVRWSSERVDGPVKIDLVHAVSAQQYDFYPVVASTENNGVYDYMVPANLNCSWKTFYLQVATLDDQTKAFSPPLDVYTEPIDLTCKVVGLRQTEDGDYYPFYAEEDEWLKFDVWIRNNGTHPQISVPTVSVRLVKEPEEVVVPEVNEEFGFSRIAPRLWYSTPKPRKYNIRHSAMYHRDDVNIHNGAYRVEVTVDPLNNLGEDEAVRADNVCITRFVIR